MSNEPGQSETPSIPIRKWEILACKILYVEPVGYEVIIPKYNLRGFLLTEAKLKVGEEVLAQYMSVRNDRILLAHMEKSAQDDIQRTSDLVIRNHKINIRRATDLFVAPLTETHKFNPVQIDQIDDLLALVAELEEGQITGCIKANCEPKFSRSAVLLYRGLAVGCIYGNQLKAPRDTETSLRMMLNDCATPGTELNIYSLPEEIVLPMSALFIGCPVERSDDLEPLSYLNYIMPLYAEKKETACLAFSFHDGNSILLLFHQGLLVGAFQVSNQEFSIDIDFVHEKLREEPEAIVESSTLPADLFTPGLPLGYCLSSNMP